MESAHTTETVQGVSSSSVENTTVRVHSRLHPRGQDLLEIDPHGSHSREQSLQGLDPAGLDSNGIGPQVSDSQTINAQGGEPHRCEAFDASPVEDDQNSANKGTHGVMVGTDDRVSKRDLVSLLEGFVRIIKTDDGGSSPGTGIELARERGLIVNEAHIDDRTVEIDQLRGLVIEAQDTIIKLLTDRVEDRSRIATLEAQLNLLPDLQAQADRAMSVAVRTEEYRTELTKMKFELDRFRLFRVRIEAEQKKGSVFNRIQKWLFSRSNAADDTLQRNTYQKMVDQSYVQPNSQAPRA